MDEEKSHGVSPLGGLGLPDDGLPDTAPPQHDKRLHFQRHLEEENKERGLATGPHWKKPDSSFYLPKIFT